MCRAKSDFWSPFFLDTQAFLFGRLVINEYIYIYIHIYIYLGGGGAANLISEIKVLGGWPSLLCGG